MKSTFTKSALFAAAVTVAIVPTVVYAASPNQSTETAIRAENDRWANAFKRGDYRAIGHLYTEDGTLLQPGGERVTGAAAISKYFTEGYTGKAPDTVTFSNFEFYGNDKVVTEVSDSIIRDHDGNLKSRGKQILIFLKQGDSWKLHRDIWNDDGPLKPGDR
ncbi:SgcJ/EcaC family oxidoreductase [Serratia nematodiphila]